MKARFSKVNQPVTCRICGKLTTQANAELCRGCYDDCGLENEHSDGFHLDEPSKACKACQASAASV